MMSQLNEEGDQDAWDVLVLARCTPPPAPGVVEAPLAAVPAAASVERLAVARAPAARRRLPIVRWALVTSVAVLSVLALAACGLSGTGADPSAEDVGLGGPATVQGVGPVLGNDLDSCAFGYSAETLAERSFAFDGVVIAVGPEGRSGHALQDTVVTFAVKHWYKGGSVAEISLDMWGPGTAASGTDSEHGAAYGIGTRMLVSGEPRSGGALLDALVAWSCGFTRYYDESTGSFWSAVFE